MTYEEKYGVDFGHEARRLTEIWEKEKAGEKVMSTKQLIMTKSEYLKLPVKEMQALYEQFPKEVTALLESE